MARRKSLAEVLLDQARKAQADRQRARERAQAQMAREQRAEAVAQERRAAQAARSTYEQQLRAAEKERAALARRVEADNRRAARSLEAMQKENERRAVVDDAARRTADLRRTLDRLVGVLVDRPRYPAVAARDLTSAFADAGPAAFAERLAGALATLTYPQGIPTATTVTVRPEARELIVERELPSIAVIPVEERVDVVRGALRPQVRKPAEVRHLYGQLLARVSLRALAEIFTAAPPELVETVVFTGWVHGVDRATGRPIAPKLVNLQVSREEFGTLVLDAPELDPEACIRELKAVISENPYDLVPIKPVFYYDLSRYKLVAGADLMVDLDSRLDLLALAPSEFETLIRQLFEGMGMKSWQTQTSRDEGVDAVAVNEDPVLGGTVIIQAKPYSKVGRRKTSDDAAASKVG